MSSEAKANFSAKALEFYSVSEFQEFSDQNEDRCLITYKREVFDVTDFLEDHPGGDQIIKDCNGRDVSDLFHSSYPHAHSKAAGRMLARYKVGELKYLDDVSPAQTAASDSDENYPHVTEDWIIYRDHQLSRKKGMIIQTLNMNKEQYLDFIHHPIHTDHTMLFEWKFFEFFTRNKWWHIPLVWIPVSIVALYLGTVGHFEDDHSRINKYLEWNSPNYNIFATIFAFAFGCFLWTAAEYLLHRFLFHLTEFLLVWKPFRYIHFLIHGIHHVIPMDGDRLVFPPPLALCIALPIFFGYLSLFGENLARIVMAGTLFAYVLYDFFHWWLHHGKDGWEYFKDLKRYHNLHHYFDDESGYGITSKFWDWVFGTMIQIKQTKPKSG